MYVLLFFADEDGLSARGFYFQQYGDISLAVSEEEEETRFIIFPPGQISESKAVELGASLPVGSCKFCPQGTYQPEVAFNCEGRCNLPCAAHAAIRPCHASALEFSPCPYLLHFLPSICVCI